MFENLMLRYTKMRTRIERKLLLLPLLYLLMCMVTSCDNELPVPGGGDKVVNENANVATRSEAMRMEVPHLKEGSHNQFIVKRARLRDNSSQNFVNFCMEYDQQKKASRWTAFRWDIDNIYDSNCGRTSSTYPADTDVPVAYRVGEGAYRGYQRGHMLASEDRQNSVSANTQTFFMTNMHPQFARFNGYDNRNSYVWVNAETLVRRLYSGWTRAYNSTDTIYAVKGGSIDSNVLGYTSNGATDNIIVPGYFYIALLYKNGRSQTQGGYKAIALWIQHREGDTTKGKDIAAKYAISIDELEEKTGIDFFCNLPDDIEAVVESSYSLAAWGWN